MLKQRLRRRAFGVLWRIAQAPRIWFYRLLSDGDVKGKPRCCQPVQFVGAGVINIEKNVSIGVFPSPYFFSSYAFIEARGSNATISIGENTAINNNFCAIALSSITIGRNCRIGANVEILDSDFHGLKIADRGRYLPEWARPVMIGSNVFIGSNAKIMKGVTIGDGAVVANGALVVNDVPAHSLAGGVPAKILRVIE